MSTALAVVDERGRTSIAQRVVEKIAATAAVEIEHVEGLRSRVAGREVGDRRARATARVDGNIAALTLDISVRYPTSIRQVTRAVRSHVSDTVTRLCGYQVDYVDITVDVLRRFDEDRRRVQ